MATSYVTVVGPWGSKCFDVTDVNGAWTTCVTVAGNINLGDALKGKRIDYMYGDSTTGVACARIAKAKGSGEVVAYALLSGAVSVEFTDVPNAELNKSVTVTEDMVLQVYTTAT